MKHNAFQEPASLEEPTKERMKICEQFTPHSWDNNYREPYEEVPSFTMQSYKQNA